MSNPKFSFFLRSRKNQEGKCPIVMTITMGKDRTQVFTGLWVLRSKWNAKTKRLKGNDEEVQTLNDTLVALTANARKVTNELLMTGKPYNPNTVKEKLKNGFSKSYGVVEAFDVFLLRMEKLIPSKYTQATLTKYTNTKERVREFTKWYAKRGDIYLYELDSAYMESFDRWLRDKYKVSHNTVYKAFQRFSRFIRFCVNRGMMERYPFPDYEIRMEVKQGHSLSFDEIQQLERFEIASPKLMQVKHLFVFAIYTGLAYIDLSQAKEDDIVEEMGMTWIRTFRQKTKSRVSVPLVSNALKSLEYLRGGAYLIPKGKLLPIKANHHLNIEIKQVCELAGIRNSEKVSWHSARRSTSALLMRAGIPLQILQRILSHKSLNTSLQYYAYTNDIMVGDAMKNLEEKLREMSKGKEK